MKQLMIFLVALGVFLVSVTGVSADGNSGVYSVSSTGYTHTGNTMANGEYPYVGIVACNMFPIGTQTLVLDGPMMGRTFVVKDRIGHSSDYDIFFNSYGEAIQYGRRSIRIQVVPEKEMVWTKAKLAFLRDQYGARVRTKY